MKKYDFIDLMYEHQLEWDVKSDQDKSYRYAVRKILTMHEESLFEARL